jgi:hypothetical protein
LIRQKIKTWAKGAKGAKTVVYKPYAKTPSKPDVTYKNQHLRLRRLGLVQAAWAKGAKIGKKDL